MEATELQSLKKALESEYILVPRSKWYFFLGGIVAFLMTAGVVSYKGALAAIGAAAGQQALAAIRDDSVRASKTRAALDQMRMPYSKELSGLGEQHQLLTTLSADVGTLRPRIKQLENGLRKVCLVHIKGRWIDLLAVPNTWTAEACTQLARDESGGGEFTAGLRCATPDGLVEAVADGPLRNNPCSWRSRRRNN